jgi:hypothetical protein
MLLAARLEMTGDCYSSIKQDFSKAKRGQGGLKPMGYEQLVRQAQTIIEPCAAFIYFAPEGFSRMEALGMNRMQGYFCGRAAPMGAVDGSVVAATFYNFNPAVVVPQVNAGWKLASPATVLAEKLAAVQEAGQRLLAPADGEADLSPNIRQALELARRATADLSPIGRSLYAAHAALPEPDDELLALYHHLTLLREYRGDGHSVALLLEEVGGLESLLLNVAFKPATTNLNFLLKSRAWDEAAVAAAREKLTTHGLLEDGQLTNAGHELRERVELNTDRLALAPFAALGEDGTQQLLTALAPVSKRIFERGGVGTPRKPEAKP